ncbi:MAG: aminotransferase class V-fold PLP-dependent enzyme [Dehalococcoidia bacterium]
MAHDALVQTWRHRFPILATKTYLANHTLGAMPATVPAALQEYAARWATDGVVAWDSWLPEIANVAAILEDIIHAPRGSMTMAQNATNALAAVLSCLDFSGSRNRIIHASAEFPTVEYLLAGHRRYGADVVRLGDDPLQFPEDEILAAIDDRTRLVVISHVLFRTAQIIDVGPIVAKAHRHGALVALDAYQSMGAVPFDVQELDVDVLIGGSVKWLCGGPGAGYLYVHPRLVGSLEPALAGWFSHASPFAFDPPPIRFAEGVARFTGGTPNIPAYYQAREGYRVIRETGVPAIREKSIRQTTLLVESAKARGWKVVSPERAKQRGNHLTIDPPHAAAVKDQLIAMGTVVDHRPGAGIRLGPHFFTSDDECTAVLSQIDDILAHLPPEAAP